MFNCWFSLTFELLKRISAFLVAKGLKRSNLEFINLSFLKTNQGLSVDFLHSITKEKLKETPFTILPQYAMISNSYIYWYQYLCRELIV